MWGKGPGESELHYSMGVRVGAVQAGTWEWGLAWGARGGPWGGRGGILEAGEGT